MLPFPHLPRPFSRSFLQHSGEQYELLCLLGVPQTTHGLSGVGSGMCGDGLPVAIRGIDSKAAMAM